jgi:hypothetical protein
MPASCFIAYASDPESIGTTIEAAAAHFHARPQILTVVTWKESPIAGKFVATSVREQINSSDCLVADISIPNFNVTYEIGYAIGKHKPILLIRNPAVRQPKGLATLGILDTLGSEKYHNSQELINLLELSIPKFPLAPTAAILNRSTPVYLLEAKYKTEAVTRIIARVKKARIFYRSFDPQETSRLSAFEALEQVSQSYGVLVHLLPAHIEDAQLHNLRASFLAGLADGLERVLAILQDGDEPVPLDYRDLVRAFRHPGHIDEIVAEFGTRVTEAIQRATVTRLPQPETLLERLSMGASSAENEIRNLGAYYLATDAFHRARRGEVRLVVGRKGSGKSALFFQLRDDLRLHRRNLILDLKPEGYKLLKFKEEVLTLLSGGTLEHTVTAFWEYLLLLEICNKLLSDDRIWHTRDHRLYVPYRKLAELFAADEFVSEGDFSERMTLLLHRINSDYAERFGSQPDTRLSEPQITELLYRHNVPALRSAVIDYLAFKEGVWILFDNIDKGWPTHGLKHEDLLIVRCLLDAARNLERQLQRREVEFETVIFLRNDVHELLIEETPDRGKEAKVLVDWTDPDMLRELLRRRLVFNDLPAETPFNELWGTICVALIDGEESSQYLIERSLMRPRALLNLFTYCRSHAVNLGHSKIEKEDIIKGVKAYSTELVYDISLEMRDVLPDAEDVLYGFIESPAEISEQVLRDILGTSDLPVDKFDDVIELLLWFGVVGVLRERNEVTYIHNVNYDMHMLKGIARKLAPRGLVYYINPAFWAALDIEN